MTRVEVRGQRARALLVEKAKPHIYRAGFYWLTPQTPLWVCEDRGGLAVGLGDSPCAAYRDWYLRVFDLRGGE